MPHYAGKRRTNVARMRHRSLIPLAILAVLGVGTAVFAVIGFLAAPNVTNIDVQNGTEKTFGSPTGSTPFLVDLVTTIANSPSSGAITQQRLVDYLPPDRMVVYDVGSTTKIAGIVRQPGINCVLNSYTAMVQGSTTWNQKGETYTRTESLADYSARVPRTSASGNSCQAVQSTAQGQVFETVILRSGYLVAARERIVVPRQNLANGHPATNGVQGETLVFIEIGGVPVRSMSS